MATLRDIRRRINSVKSTQQITKAMKMVAAAKLRRAQERLFNSRPYAEGLAELLAHIAAKEGPELHPLLATPEVENTCYVVVSSDRGLCGSFNANVIRRGKNEIQGAREVEQIERAAMITVGRKGFEHFSRREFDVEEKFINLFDSLTFQNAVEISDLLQQKFLNGEFDRIQVIFNRFESAGVQRVVMQQLLPIVPQMPETEKYNLVDYIYEPSPERILDDLCPKNLNIQMWRALLESNASEHAARMVAMDSATENAAEMIYDLTLYYNKVRQAAITKEISEIVGGAEALSG